MGAAFGISVFTVLVSDTINSDVSYSASYLSQTAINVWIMPVVFSCLELSQPFMVLYELLNTGVQNKIGRKNKYAY